ncbi:MAG: DUF5312 domain-containing protein [Treponema sp.]|nr:DUF5312 domain-containing protein [Treponema sp.]
MADTENFKKLAAGLSMEERQNLLEKLKSQSQLSGEPLYREEKAAVPVADMASEYSGLPWYYRLWFFFLSFFKAKAPAEIYADYQVAGLGQAIEERSPGLYDYQKDLLLPAFYRQVERLKTAIRFFYSTLDMSVNQDRGAFFSFLGSLEMPDVHKRLEAETDPGLIVKQHPDTPEMELRQIAFKAMDEGLSLITENYRNAMYSAARSLNCLKGLSSFLFDRLMMAFGFHAPANGQACSAAVVRELLVSLNNILVSLRVVPPMPLLESLFVFTLQERTGESGFDMNRELRLLLAKAEESLEVVREFNKQVPLAWIIRCSTRNMSFSPREISGGEDWFVVYRDYWKRRIESLFADYMRDRRRQDLLNSFRYFLKGTSLKILGNTVSESNPDGLPIKGSFGLSFLLTFYSAVFMAHINKLLRPVLIDGEFQKKENRVEFTESYNNLIKLEDDIKKFEREISPTGDYGRRYAQVRQDISPLPVKRRKIQIVLDEAERDAARILDQARAASRSMVNILDGILGRDSRGKYDSLSNLAKLAGKGNQFMTGLDETIQQFQRVLSLLDDIDAMENGR